jgi:hypothetical protein
MHHDKRQELIQFPVRTHPQQSRTLPRCIRLTHLQELASLLSPCDIYAVLHLITRQYIKLTTHGEQYKLFNRKRSAVLFQQHQRVRIFSNGVKHICIKARGLTSRSRRFGSQDSKASQATSNSRMVVEAATSMNHLPVVSSIYDNA